MDFLIEINYNISHYERLTDHTTRTMASNSKIPRATHHTNNGVQCKYSRMFRTTSTKFFHVIQNPVNYMLDRALNGKMCEISEC